MAKRLNKQLVGVLMVTGVLVIVGAGAAVINTLPQRDPEFFAKKAEQFYHENNLSAAARAYVQAFEWDKAKSTKYLERGAEIAWEAGDVPFAAGLCHKALTVGTSQRAMELLVEISFTIARLYGGTPSWVQVFEQANKLLPTDAAALASLEKEKPEVVAMALHARGEAALSRAAESPTYAGQGVADLMRVVLGDVEKGTPPLKPDNVGAAKSLRDWWLLEASRKSAAGEDPAQVEKLVRDAAAVVAKVNAAAEASKDPMPRAEATVARMLPFVIATNVEMPPPLVVIGDPKNHDELRKLLTQVKADVEATEATLTPSDKRRRQVVNLRLAMAEVYRGMNDAKEAEAVLVKTTELHKDEPRPFLALGGLLRRAQRDAEEEKVYESALAGAKPREGILGLDAKLARAEIYDALMKIEMRRIGRATSAPAAASAPAELTDETLKKADSIRARAEEEFGRDFFLCKLLRARILREKGDAANAIKELEQADKDTNNVGGAIGFDIKGLLADLYDRQGLPGLAEQMCISMKEMQPSAWQPYLALARLQLRQNRVKDALTNLNVLLEGEGTRPPLTPGFPDALLLRAEAYSRLGMHDKAEADLATTRGLGGSPVMDKIRQAALEAARQRYDNAEALVKEVLAAEPANSAALNLLFNILDEVNRRADLVPILERARQADPSSLEVQRMLAVVDPKLSEEERTRLLLESIDAMPDPFERAIQKYHFYRTRKMLNEAVAALDEAEKVKPDSPIVIEYQFLQAVLKAQLTEGAQKPDWARAQEYVRKARQYNTDLAQGKMYEGRLRLAMAEMIPVENKSEMVRGLTDAAVILQQALQVYPSNALGWTQLGQTYLRLGKLTEARAALQEAVRMEPNNGLAHWLLATVYQRQGDEAKMEEHVTAAHNDPRLQRNDQIREAFEQVTEYRNPERGVRRRLEWAEKHPDDVTNWVQLANLYSRLGRTTECKETLAKARALAPDDVGVTIALATFERNHGRSQNGIVLMEQLLPRLKEASEKSRLCKALAEFYERAGDAASLRKAEEHARNVFEFDKSVETATLVAGFYARQGILKEAAKWFEQATELAKDDPSRVRELTKEVIQVYLLMRDLNRCDELIRQFRTRFAEDADGIVFDGTVAIMRGDFDKAMDCFDENIRLNPESAVAYWQRGQLYAVSGDTKRAIEDLRKARDFAAGPPGLPGYHHRIQLAVCLFEQGEVNDAVAELTAAITDAKRQTGYVTDLNPLAQTAVDILMSVNPPRASEAESILLEMRNAFPRDPIWVLRRGDLARDRKDYVAATEQYEEALKLSLGAQNAAGALRAIDSLVRTYELSGEPARVAALLSRPEVAPLVKNVPLLSVQLAAAQFREGREAEAWAAFVAALEPAAADPLSMRTMVLAMIRTVPAEKALELAWQQLASKPDEPTLRKLEMILLGEAGKTAAQVEAGVRLLESVTTPAERSFALLVVANQLYALGKYEEAAARFREVLEVDPNNVAAMNNLAYLLADQLNRADEALPYAEKAASMRPNDLAFVDTLGWCQTLAGRYSDARGTFFRCLRTQMDFLPARIHLGVLYKREGKDLAAAKRNLEMALRLALLQKDAESQARIQEELKGL